MLLKLVAVAVALAMLHTPLTARAIENDDYLPKEPNHLVVGVYNAPPSVEVRNGELTGVTVIMARRLVARVSPTATVKFVPATVPRLIRELEKGRLDLAYLRDLQKPPTNAVKLTQAFVRETELWSLQPIFPDYAHPEPTALERLRIGSLPHNLDIPLLKRAQGVSVANTKLLIPMLMGNRVNAVYSFKRSLSYHAVLHQLSENDFVRTSISQVPVFLWTHQDSKVTQKLPQWRKAAAELHTDRNDQRIWEDYKKQLRQRAALIPTALIPTALIPTALAPATQTPATQVPTIPAPSIRPSIEDSDAP